jgi:nitroreductase
MSETTEPAVDEYQQRYLAHQERKRDVLKLIAERHSERQFAEREFSAGDDPFAALVYAIDHAPSSCDRRGVKFEFVWGRKHKALLSGALVGGVGWLHRASAVIVFYADMDAYKSPAEKGFMPYLDTGFMAQNAYLACTELGLASCFVNPNAYYDIPKLLGWSGNLLVTGAMAIGYPLEDKA